MERESPALRAADAAKGANVVFLVGYRRSGTNFLRSYFEQHAEIRWTRTLHRLLNERSDGTGNQPAEYKNLPTGVKAVVDVGEQLITGRIVRDQKLWRARRFSPRKAWDEDMVYVDIRGPAETLNRLAPNGRIIVALRNQIDWLRTHYRVFYPELPVNERKWQDFLTTPEGRLTVEDARYDRGIATYMEVFGRGNVHVILTEEMGKDPEGSLGRLCEFLGVNHMPLNPALATYNRGPDNVDHWLYGAATRLVGQRSISGVGRWLGRPIKRAVGPYIGKIDPLSGGVRETLRAVYAGSNRRTQELISKDLRDYGYPV